ncbi:MAG: alpha/beta hydrolase [Planctomycetota bacterium]
MNTITNTLATATVVLAGQAHAHTDYRVERITFESHGHTLVGNLYIPQDVSPRRPAEGVVVTGAWTTIKEQMPGLYAAELAERGLVALAFDFRTWGESQGETRSLENPAMKIEDIEAAAAFLADQPEVTAVNGLGICASAGYVASVAERGAALESVALVAPWLHDAEIVEAVYGGPEGVRDLIETGRTGAAAERETGSPVLIPASGPVGSDALMPIDGYYADPARGRIEAWENTFNIASWEGWLTFDGIRTARGITEPVLIVHSDAAAIPHGARAFFEDLGGPKDAVWLDDVTQFDFYDEPEAVTRAADAAVDHFVEN